MRCMFFAALVAFAAAQQTIPLTELAVFDCSGTARVLPGTDFESAVQVTGLPEMVQYLYGQLKGQAQCRCPGITDDELTRKFSFPQAALNIWGPNPDESSTCQTDNSFWTLLRVKEARPKNLSPLTWDVPLPSTCTYKDYQTSGCAVQTNAPGGMGHFQLAMKGCPGNPNLPYVSISLAGSLEKLFQPCQGQSDCGNLQCTDVYKNHLDHQVDEFRNTLLDLKVIDPSTLDCLDLPTVISKVSTLLGASAPTQQFCLPGNAFTARNAADFMGASVITRMTNSTWPYYAYETSIKGLLPWDGKLSSGASVFAADRMSGKAFKPIRPVPRPLGMGLMSAFGLSCDGNIYLQGLQSFGMSIIGHAPWMQSWLKSFSDMMRATTQCSAAKVGVKLDDNEWTRWFAAWTPQYYLARGTVPLPSVPQLSFVPSLEAPIQGLGYAAFAVYRWIVDTVQQASDYRFYLPSPYWGINWLAEIPRNHAELDIVSSCSLATVESSGTCMFKFTSLAELFGVPQFDAVVEMQQCMGDKDAATLPSIYINGTGSVLNLLSSPLQQCTSDFDCESGLTCQAIRNSGGWDAYAGLLSPNAKCSNSESVFEDLFQFARKTPPLVPPRAGESEVNICFPKTRDILYRWDTWGRSLYRALPGNQFAINGLESYKRVKIMDMSQGSTMSKSILLIVLLASTLVACF